MAFARRSRGVWATTFLSDAVTEQDGIARIGRPMLHGAVRLRGPLIDPLAAGIARGSRPVGMPLLALAAGGPISAGTRSRLPVATSVVDRHRPSQRDAIPPFEHSPSFPRGHTLNATVVTGSVADLLMLEQRSSAAQSGTAAAGSPA